MALFLFFIVERKVEHGGNGETDKSTGGVCRRTAI